MFSRLELSVWGGGATEKDLLNSLVEVLAAFSEPGGSASFPRPHDGEPSKGKNKGKTEDARTGKGKGSTLHLTKGKPSKGIKGTSKVSPPQELYRFLEAMRLR